MKTSHLIWGGAVLVAVALASGFWSKIDRRFSDAEARLREIETAAGKAKMMGQQEAAKDRQDAVSDALNARLESAAWLRVLERFEDAERRLDALEAKP